MEVELNNLWLVFWEGDGGDSESYSVFYSKIVNAKTKTEALEKYAKRTDSELKWLDAIPVSKQYIS
jgi:hypothetical protein